MNFLKKHWLISTVIGVTSVAAWLFYKPILKFLKKVFSKESIDKILDTNASNDPAGIRANNPLNIHYRSTIHWDGQIGNDNSSGENLAVFVSPDMGARAAFINLDTYNKKHGVNTIQSIVNRWAEANTDEYAKFLADKLDVDTGYYVTVEDRAQLLYYMHIWEQGKEYFNLKFFNNVYETHIK